VKQLLIRALKFRQDHRIKKIFLPFLPPARRAYASERRKAKSIIPLQGKVFNHCANNTVISPRRRLYEPEAGSREKKSSQSS